MPNYEDPNKPWSERPSSVSEQKTGVSRLAVCAAVATIVVAAIAITAAVSTLPGRPDQPSLPAPINTLKK